MKKLAIALIAVFCISGLAIAQDQQIQNINIKILQLSAQRDYNNALYLEEAQRFTNRKNQFNEQIQQLVKQREALNKPAPIPDEPK